jgi:cold shock CspA family protein
MEGTIKKIVREKYFGFIVGRDKKEYFFHKSGLKNARFEDLKEGQEVIFEDAEGREGKLRAEDVYI